MADLYNPSELQGTLVQQGGQLKKTKPTAITPAGASTQGVTPDSAKMAGTPAQKAPVLKQVSAMPDTGIVKEDKTKQAAIQQAQAQADKLTPLKGAITAAVKTAAARLMEQAAKTPVVDKNVHTLTTEIMSDPLFKGIDPESAAETIYKVINNPTNINIVNETMETLANQIGLDNAKEAIKKFSPTSNQIISKTVEAASDKLTVQNLIDSNETIKGNIDNLAGLLGLPIDSLKTLSVQEFQQKIDDLRNTVFNHVTNLEQQKSSVPVGSAQEKILNQQIAQYVAAGGASQRQWVEDTTNLIKQADEFTINNKTVTLEDILKDENLSTVISDYVLDPVKNADLLPPEIYGKLGEFVNANLKTFQEMVDHAETAKGNLKKFSEQTFGGFDVATFNKLVGKKEGSLYTNKESDFKNMGVGKVTTSPDTYGLSPEDLTLFVASVSKDPEKYKTWSDTQLADRFKKGKEIQNNPILSNLLGVSGGDILDDNLNVTYEQAKPLADYIKDKKFETKGLIATDQGKAWLKKQVDEGKGTALAEAFKSSQLAETIWDKQEIINALHNGTLTWEDIKGQYDWQLDKAVEFAKGTTEQFRGSVDAATNWDQFLDALFPDQKDDDWGDLQHRYDETQLLAKIGDPNAQKNLQPYFTLDTNRDGRLDNTDIDSLKNKIKETGSLDLGANIKNYVQGKPITGNMFEGQRLNQPSYDGIYGAVRGKLQGDNEITKDDFIDLADKYGRQNAAIVANLVNSQGVGRAFVLNKKEYKDNKENQENTAKLESYKSKLSKLPEKIDQLKYIANDKESSPTLINMILDVVASDYINTLKHIKSTGIQESANEFITKTKKQYDPKTGQEWVQRVVYNTALTPYEKIKIISRVAPSSLDYLMELATKKVLGNQPANKLEEIIKADELYQQKIKTEQQQAQAQHEADIKKREELDR